MKPLIKGYLAELSEKHGLSHPTIFAYPSNENYVMFIDHDLIFGDHANQIYSSIDGFENANTSSS